MLTHWILRPALDAWASFVFTYGVMGASEVALVGIVTRHRERYVERAVSLVIDCVRGAYIVPAVHPLATMTTSAAVHIPSRHPADPPGPSYPSSHFHEADPCFAGTDVVSLWAASAHIRLGKRSFYDAKFLADALTMTNLFISW